MMHALGCRLETAMAQRSRGRQDDRFVEAAGAHVRIRDVGSGPLAVVFVPDPPNVLEHHEVAFTALSRHVRVVGLELPGFGFSRPGSGFGFSVEENCDVVLAVLDALGVDRAVLALSCVAGLISVAAAVRRPDRIVGVVAIQSADLAGALAWADRVDRQRLVRTPLLGQLMVRLNRRRLAHSWYRAAAGAPERVESLERVAIEAYDAGAAYALASGLQALTARDTEHILGTLTDLPAAAVWGRQDRTHRRTDRAAQSRYFPKLEVIEIDDAGHFPELEAEETFRVELLRWMEANRIG